MNYDILMSIKPKWFDLIASGKKTLEIRLSKPSLDFDMVWFYVSGTGRIKGLARVPQIRRLDLREDWGAAQKESLVSRSEAIKYAKGRSSVWGWSIAGFQPLFLDFTLEDFGLRRPPMSWRYFPSGEAIKQEATK